MLINPPNIGETVKDPDLWRQFMDQFFGELTAKLRSVCPAGSLMPWPGMDLPEGWVECDNTEYDQLKYEELYRAIGQKFGGSSGTFKVPDAADLPTLSSDFIWVIKV